MEEHKSFLVDLAETLERHWPRRSSSQTPHWGRQLIKHLIPNLGSVLLVLILLSVFPGLAAPLSRINATSISTIPYQGRLADVSGNPVTGKQNMEFRIYNVPTDGAPLWEEFWTGANSVDISDGLFSVMLGSINTGLTTVVQGNTTLYLGITVGTDSEMTPRVQLGSVPFSIWSLTVADNSINSLKIADNAVGSSEIANGAVTSSKQTITTYYAEDNTFQTLDGNTNITISTFEFQNVPAGEVFIIVTFLGNSVAGRNPYGAVYLESPPGAALTRIPTHVFTTTTDQFVLHGRVANFPGGRLTIRLSAAGENSDTKLEFGAFNGDGRFGRRITVMAGL